MPTTIAAVAAPSSSLSTLVDAVFAFLDAHAARQSSNGAVEPFGL